MRGTSATIRALGRPSLPVSIPQSQLCPKGCGSTLQFGTDAIGRETSRCPKCDGVAKPRKISPNEALIPQGLVPAYRELPPPVPGERCAHCHQRIPQPKPPRPPLSNLCKGGCGTMVSSLGGRKRWCNRPECLAQKPGYRPPPRCIACNDELPRKKGKGGKGHKRRCSKPECRPRPKRACKGCGGAVSGHRGLAKEWCDKTECLEKAPPLIRHYRLFRLAQIEAKAASKVQRRGRPKRSAG